MSIRLHDDPPSREPPARATVKDNDRMLENRAEEHLFKLSRYEGTLQKRSMLASDDPYKILKKRREEEAEFKLPQKEFTARQRYKDSDGNVLAPAIESDELYKSLLRHGKVDELDPTDAMVGRERIANVRGLPRKGGQRRDEMGTVGTYYGKVLMFVSMKRDGKVHKWPKGDIEFVDPSTDTVFSGVVVKSVFKNRSKSGYVIMHDVVSWGKLSNPAEFFGAK